MEYPSTKQAVTIAIRSAGLMTTRLRCCIIRAIQARSVRRVTRQWYYGRNRRIGSELERAPQSDDYHRPWCPPAQTGRGAGATLFSSIGSLLFTNSSFGVPL